MIDPETRGAWRDLAVKLRPFVARRVSVTDLDDVMQDLFVRLHRGVASLRDEDRFGPWIYRVARSAIAEHHRKIGVRRANEVKIDAPDLDESDDPAAERELAGYIAPFVAALPSPYREALTLTELGGMTQQEAADALGVSLTAMKSRVQRGRQQLRASFEACCTVALDVRGRIMAVEPKKNARLPTLLDSTRFVSSGREAGPSRLARWRSSDISDSKRWIHRLNDNEIADVEAVARSMRGRDLASLSAADLPKAGPLHSAAAGWRRALHHGHGFILVRGLDVDRYDATELEWLFVALGHHLGSPVPQNLALEYLTHIRDTGSDPSLAVTRLYTTRAEQDFHTDGADLVGLLCRRTSRIGGESRIASSEAIVAEIEKRRPDLYRVLFEEWPWHYQEQGREPLWFRRAICTAPSGERTDTFFIPWYIRRSQTLPDAPRLTAAQHEALALLEELANDPTFFIDMTFEPGDVQWLRNASILHKRTAYEDHDEPDRKRHLLRLWLSADDHGPDLGDLEGAGQ